MTFFVGDLVVSVSGCNIDENAGPLVDPCVELSVGNKLHSTRLPVSSRSRNGPPPAGQGSKRRSPAVAFHGVTEGCVSFARPDRNEPCPAVRRPPSEPFCLLAEPLRCTHWGAGGRAARRTCTVAPPEEVRRLAICWSPAIRLRRPLSMVARAGRLTGKVVSRKIDRPVGAALNLVLDALETAAGLCSTALPLDNPRWRAAALVASAVSLSLGSVLVAAAAAFFLPVALAVSAAAAAVFAALAPPTLAIGWVLACTGPACEQLWRPLLVWMGTRWGFLRRSLLLPMDAAVLRSEGGDGRCLSRSFGPRTPTSTTLSSPSSAPCCQPSPSAAVEDAQRAEERLNTMMTVDGGLDGTGDGATPVRGAADAGAVVLLLACYQNLIGVLHTGLEASRWRPRPR
ncbi:unnamed protein product [Scytosiphon promiscuus]